MGLILVTLLLGAVAIGCGSSEDSSSGEMPSGGAAAAATGKEKEAPSSATQAPDSTARGADSSQKSRSGHSEDSPARPDSSKRADGASSGAGSQTADSGPGHRRAWGHKAAGDCPDGLSAAECGALVEAYGQAKAKGADATTLESPRDCLAVMSRGECEAMLGAQKAAAEAAGTPIIVEECMRNPTPRCEEALKQMFESQRGN